MADQAYLRSEEWQAGERESLAAVARGEALVFDGADPNDVVRWLLDDEPPGRS